MPLLYDELLRAARSCVMFGGPDPTLQPTALVHEFYLKATGLQTVDWQDRAHFIRAAARTMRNISVDAIRRRNAAKRGGGRNVPLTGDEPAPAWDLLDLIAVDAALTRFAAEFPRHAQVVELVFFGGLNSAETARVMSSDGEAISQRTVERDWQFARAWLHSELGQP